MYQSTKSIDETSSYHQQTPANNFRNNKIMSTLLSTTAKTHANPFHTPKRNHEVNSRMENQAFSYEI